MQYSTTIRDLSDLELFVYRIKQAMTAANLTHISHKAEFNRPIKASFTVYPAVGKVEISFS